MEVGKKYRTPGSDNTVETEFRGLQRDYFLFTHPGDPLILTFDQRVAISVLYRQLL